MRADWLNEHDRVHIGMNNNRVRIFHNKVLLMIHIFCRMCTARIPHFLHNLHGRIQIDIIYKYINIKQTYVDLLVFGVDTDGPGIDILAHTFHCHLVMEL